MNEAAKEDLVSELMIDGKRHMYIKPIKIDVAIVRGTTADYDGNVTCERESLYTDNMIQAMAAHNTRGTTMVAGAATGGERLTPRP